ncbi:MAG TPA: undecaprenyldiphospho-muramoylpentapeptide beta-N-acetylglucosaminyltransferase [Terriglobia bacterium]|nr:undecaprenyldiphospho-muramoylpentapeptide beta-N-acetylglucosaminyltransferase [Terriglobia bacterium]
MKAIIAGGGTGGHLFPGIAVARELQRRHPGCEVLFVGAEQGIEAKVVPAEGFPLRLLPVGGINRVSWKKAARNIVAAVKSLFEARRILKEFQPSIVIGVGGYASFPMMGAAIISGFPRMIMEQNAIPGLANRTLGRWMDFVAVTDPRTVARFGAKARVTGNPIRPQFKAIGPKEHRPPYRVLVFGGSQGAQAINNAVVESLPWLADWKDKICFTHQTGARQLEDARRAYSEAGFDADARAFLDNIYEHYAAADLIVSRAGMTTISEIKASGRAAILVPLPFAADDHQRANARGMESEGAAVMIENAELTGERFARVVRELLSDHDRLVAMERSARRLAVLDAESRIADLAEQAIALRGGRQ